MGKFQTASSLKATYQHSQVRMEQNMAIVVDYERVTVHAESVGRRQTCDLSDRHINTGHTEQISRSHLDNSLLPDVLLQVLFGDVLIL